MTTRRKVCVRRGIVGVVRSGLKGSPLGARTGREQTKGSKPKHSKLMRTKKGGRGGGG